MDVRTPGIHTETPAGPPRNVITDPQFVPGGVMIDGSHARDPLHTSYVTTLRAGVILGVHTGDLWRPSFIGAVTANYTSGGTELTVSVATATEIVRRVGTSGTLNLTHAPTAGGTVVPYATLTYSAVNLSTGVLTITNIGANVVAGSLIGPPVADLSYIPRRILCDPWGVKVVDIDGNDIDPPAKLVAYGGYVDINQVVNYPGSTLTTHRTWLRGVLQANANFVFGDLDHA